MQEMLIGQLTRLDLYLNEYSYLCIPNRKNFGFSHNENYFSIGAAYAYSAVVRCDVN